MTPLPESTRVSIARRTLSWQDISRHRIRWAWVNEHRTLILASFHCEEVVLQKDAILNVFPIALSPHCLSFLCT